MSMLNGEKGPESKNKTASIPEEKIRNLKRLLKQKSVDQKMKALQEIFDFDSVPKELISEITNYLWLNYITDTAVVEKMFEIIKKHDAKSYESLLNLKNKAMSVSLKKKKTSVAKSSFSIGEEEVSEDSEFKEDDDSKEEFKGENENEEN